LTPDIDRAFLQAKLFFIVERLEYLKKYYAWTLEELSADFEKLKAVEKVIQEIVDCAVDINQYVAEVFLNVEIRSNKDSFWKVQKILNRDDADIRKLVDTVSFRNEIVHSYDVGIRAVWKKRSISYFVDIYRHYVEDATRLLTSID
jgi:uncharacterized protein YutE (UPF0331/DUF86 family)